MTNTHHSRSWKYPREICPPATYSMCKRSNDDHDRGRGYGTLIFTTCEALFNAITCLCIGFILATSLAPGFVEVAEDIL